MKTKEVQQILLPPPSHMVGDGFRVHNFFPSGYSLPPDRMSPFYLLDYNAKMDFSPRQEPRGVGAHPHRGFETVTIVYHGKLVHQDSFGHRGVIGAGDIQWMTAGAGILYKEYHEKKFSRQGGSFQLVQLWINLPARYKMSPPAYQTLSGERLRRYHLPEGGGVVEVIAGEFKGVKGNARTFTPIEMYNFRLRAGETVVFSLPSHYNTGMLVLEGEVKVNGGEAAQEDRFILFRNDGEEVALEAVTDCVLLLLSGEPIREAVIAYGPFLMNSKEEIIRAYEDLNSGKFGELED